MNLVTKRFGLVLASVIGVGAIAVLVAGTTFALFTSSSSPSSQTFTAGTVKLDNPTSASCTTDVTNMEPGDSGTCDFSVDYDGSLPAYIGAVLNSSDDTGLLSGLTLTINGDPASATTPVLIGQTYSGTPPYTATLGYTLSPNADNSYQGTAVTLTVTFEAVQCSNNGELSTGVADSGTNEDCTDPGPASWSQTAAVDVTFFSTCTGSSAGWNSDDTAVDLAVAAGDGCNAGLTLNNVGSSLPADAPSFDASYYASGTPRWYIQLGPSITAGPYLFGYPDGTWNVNNCGSVSGGTTFDYSDAVNAIATNCPTYENDVTSVNIVADTSAPAPYTTTLTDIQYNGQSITAG